MSRIGKNVHSGYKRDMDILTGHIGEWSILVSLLLFLGYAMRKIATENRAYKDDSYYVQFEALRFSIPNWWTQEILNSHSLRFYRSDTSYNWQSLFQWVPIKPEKNTLETIFDQYLLDNKIEFDPEVIVETNPAHLFTDKEIAQYFSEFIRVEGTATKDNTDRVYLDLVLFRHTNEHGYFELSSLSSVLNGGVEGPYFEEALKSARLIKKDA